MKKLFFTTLILLGCYTLTNAQTRNATEFGIDVGYNSSYLIESQSNYNTDFRSGLNVGVSADHYFSDTWSLKVKAIYDQKGWGNGFIVQPSGPTLYNVDFKLDYLTVPVMANWHFGRTRNWYFNFGPYIGFLLDASASDNYPGIKDSFNTVDGGIALGVGIKIPINQTSKFFIEYDGQGGATNVFKNSDSNYQNIRESINIGINF
jgi:hypothetical protein